MLWIFRVEYIYTHRERGLGAPLNINFYTKSQSYIIINPVAEIKVNLNFFLNENLINR